MTEHFTPPAPKNAVDLLNGRASASNIVDAMNCAYWAHCDGAQSAECHRRAIHREFAELAAALGYTIARKPEPFMAVDAAEPAGSV